MKLQIKSKKDFISNVLGPISNLNDKTIIKIEKDKITSLTASSDATLILYSETQSVSNSERSINIPDIKKLKCLVKLSKGNSTSGDLSETILTHGHML